MSTKGRSSVSSVVNGSLAPSNERRLLLAMPPNTHVAKHLAGLAVALDVSIDVAEPLLWAAEDAGLIRRVRQGFGQWQHAKCGPRYQLTDAGLRARNRWQRKQRHFRGRAFRGREAVRA